MVAGELPSFLDGIVFSLVESIFADFCRTGVGFIVRFFYPPESFLSRSTETEFRDT